MGQTKTLAPAEVLRAAADEIAKRGLYKKLYGEPGVPAEVCKLCTIGALNFVQVRDPDGFAEGTSGLLNHIADLLPAEVHHDSDFETVTDWNDDPERTADEVVAKLREVATYLDGAS